MINWEKIYNTCVGVKLDCWNIAYISVERVYVRKEVCMDNTKLWDFIDNPQSNNGYYEPVQFNSEGNIEEMWKLLEGKINARVDEQRVDQRVSHKQVRQYRKEVKQLNKDRVDALVKEAQDSIIKAEQEISFHENALKTHLSREEKKVHRSAIEEAKKNIKEFKYNIKNYKSIFLLDRPYTPFRAALAIIFSPLTLPIGFALWIVASVVAYALFVFQTVINIFARFIWIPMVVLGGIGAIVAKSVEKEYFFNKYFNNEYYFKSFVIIVVVGIGAKILVHFACKMGFMVDVENDGVFAPWDSACDLAKVALFFRRVAGDVLHACGHYMFNVGDAADMLGEFIFVGPFTYKLFGKLFGAKLNKEDVIADRKRKKEKELSEKYQVKRMRTKNNYLPDLSQGQDDK